MLVLTRKVGESIVINEDIYFTVVGIRGGQVRLAFDAPRSIPIHREEIQRRIYREQVKDDWSGDTSPNKEKVVDRLIRKFKTNDPINTQLEASNDC